MEKNARTANLGKYKLKIVTCGEKVNDHKNVINIPSIYDFTPNFYSTNTLSMPSLLKGIELINKEKPDQIIISTPGPIGFLGLLISKLLNIHCTGIYHTDYGIFAKKILNDDGIEDLVDKSMKWFFSQTDNIKVPSMFYIEHLEKTGYDLTKMSLLKRGIDFDLFNPSKRVENPNFTIVWAGRIGKEKNVGFLYNVYKYVTSVNPNIHLTIAGEGPDFEANKKLFSKFPICQMLGRLTRVELTSLYASSDLLVFPSVVDTFGMVVLEAQASGLPAIVTDKGGPQEIITPNESGFVLEELTPEVWGEKILEIANLKNINPQEYNNLRINSRKNVEEKYSWEGMINDVIAV